jgi:hypothetical protein
MTYLYPEGLHNSSWATTFGVATGAAPHFARFPPVRICFASAVCETPITIVSIDHSNSIQLSAASRWERNQRRSREEEEERDSPKRGN